MKRKLTAVLLSVLFALGLLSSALAADTEREVEYLPDGSYYVTLLEDETPGIALLSTTRTKSKTITSYSNSGEALWYVRVTGTFTYDGSTAKCTASSVTAKSYVSNWTITHKSATHSGNKATATATAKRVWSQGGDAETVKKSVVLTCSADGTFS